MNLTLKATRRKRTTSATSSFRPPGTLALEVVLEKKGPDLHTVSNHTLFPGDDLSAFYRGPGKGLPDGAVLQIERELDSLNKIRITGG